MLILYETIHICFAGRGHTIGHCFEDIKLVVWEYLLEVQHTHPYSRHAQPQEFIVGCHGLYAYFKFLEMCQVLTSSQSGGRGV